MGLLLQANLVAQESRSDTESDREEIQQAIVGYVDAINDGDAETAASYWSETGVWIGPDGNEIVGAKAIAKHMSDLFKSGSMPTIELIDVHVRFIAPGVATEEGQVVVNNPDELPNRTTYISIHVKTENGWKLDSVRETVIAVADSNYEHLRDLDWMVGDWVDQEGGISVETNCEWTSNRNFLLRTFRVVNGDDIEMEGTQVVGWDADRQQIRSWVFDSDGGFGTGYWTRQKNGWVIEASFQTSDGTKGSSLNRFTMVNRDQFTYQSTNRVLGDESLPDIQEITVVRRVNTEETDDNNETEGKGSPR